MSVGKRLREWGKKHYKKMTKFSEALDIDYSTLQRYLSDQRKPSPEVLLKLNELGCDINILLTGHYESDPKKVLNNIIYESLPDNYITIPKKEYEKLHDRIAKLEKEKIEWEKDRKQIMKLLQNNKL